MHGANMKIYRTLCDFFLPYSYISGSFFAKDPKLVLGPIKPSVLSANFFTWGKQPGREASHPLTCSVEARNSWREEDRFNYYVTLLDHHLYWTERTTLQYSAPYLHPFPSN
jgi:hypothetical protein